MFVDHIFAKSDTLPIMPACMYQYVVASNGVFVRAARPGLSALIWVAATHKSIRGLHPVEPYVRLFKTIPAHLTDHLFKLAFENGHKEKLFYLQPSQVYGWLSVIPDQMQTAGSVHPTDPYAAGKSTLIEVHSHHTMQPFFSDTDNRDESTGFRIFAVMGCLQKPRPAMRVRVGIYGHFWEIPAQWVFDDPGYVIDAAFDTERNCYAD